MPQPLPRLTRRFRYVVLLGAVVAGCSTNSSFAPAGNTQLGASPVANVRRSALLSEGFGKVSIQGTRAKSWIAPELQGRALNIYWGDYYNSTIAIYPRGGINPPEKGLITKGISHPERLFVDNALAVYATNIGNNTITAYKPHRTKPSLRISTGVDTPTGLTVDAAGTVYCANVGNDTITVYPKGQTTPSLTIPITGSPEYLAIDGSDNLYVTYFGGSKGSGVLKFAPGSTTGQDLGLDMTGGGALEVDRSGNIVIADNYGSTIDVFPANQTEPSRRIGMAGGGEAFGLSLSEKDHKLFASVLTNDVFTVQQLDYPKLTKLTTILSTNAGDWPIAVSRDAVL
ncbi:MAG: hypothetical protein WB615_02150 [Candidatus Tumulicola sp.]